MKVTFLLFLISAASSGAAGASALAPRATEEDVSRRLGAGIARLEVRADGRAEELEALEAPRTGSPREAAMEAVLRLGDLLRDPQDGTTLFIESVRESLTAEHVRIGQRLDGIPVLDGQAVVTFDRTRGRMAVINRFGVLAAGVSERPVAASSLPAEVQGKTIVRTERSAVAVDGVIRRAKRLVVLDGPNLQTSWFLDEISGEILRILPHYFTASGRIFPSNPVTRLNDPSLRDENDSALSVPSTAYTTVELRDLSGGQGLAGPNVRVLELESPKTSPANPGGSLQFDRAAHGFEEVMVYHHIDSSIRHLQSLGYEGSRSIFSGPLEVDAHAASGADQSYYRWGSDGAIYFGDGGVDDAEDPDIIHHELGHAIQDAIAPFVFAGSFASQARAIGEGFGDYWAFSAGYEESAASGRDAFCIADWDARCWDGPSSSCGYDEGSACLRRVDSSKTMAEYVNREQSGVEHGNGEIWSSALREIFLAAISREGIAAGRTAIDRIVIESHFGAPPSPGFRAIGRRMLEADRVLNASANQGVICAAMVSRGIFGDSDCSLTPRGGYTRFQSTGFDLPIPDSDPAGLMATRYVEDDRRIAAVRVRVNLTHPHRGDLRIHLIAPDGRTIILQAPGPDAGEDIETVYGSDTDPVEPLSLLEGLSARGLWTLHVIDAVSRDAGTLHSWAIEILFEGDAELVARPVSARALHIPAVAHSPGAGQTFYVSDAMLLNRGTANARVTVIFTPSGADGRTRFAAVELSIAPGQQVALDDLVDDDFRATGLGSVQITGDIDPIVVTSRTYNDAETGTFGQFIPAFPTAAAVGRNDPPHHVVQLRDDSGFRSNLGFSEVAGESASVVWTIFDGEGRALEEGSLQLAPYSHMQVAILGGQGGAQHDLARAEVRVTAGEGRILTYGSVVDNLTGDAIFVPGEPAGTSPARRVAAVIRGDGAAGTRWRSDLWVSNLSAISGIVDLEWRTAAGAIRESTLNLGAGASVRVSDLIGALWGEQVGNGSLRLTSSLPAWIAASRTWTPGGGGSFGQFIPAVPESQATGAGEPPLAIPQLAENGAFRTNIGMTEVTGMPVVVSIAIRDAGGGELWSTRIPLGAGEQRQITIRIAGAPSFSNGYAWVEVLSGAGRILAYGSVVDNLSGDPVYLPGR